jgi:hypothetical protein
LTAAKKYGVPETTLRDRVSGRVDIDCCNMGKSPILSLDEENKLMKHLLEVANIGYGYNRKESDYTVTLGQMSVYLDHILCNSVTFFLDLTTKRKKNIFFFILISLDPLQIYRTKHNNLNKFY